MSRQPITWPEGRFLVALSGGADSAVAAAEAVLAAPGRVRAVHVHHGLEHSDKLADAALDVARHLKIECIQVAVVVSDRGSFEANARRERYAAIEAIAESDEWLVSGHHQRDQAETVLLHLLRGSGTTGLSGIPAVRNRWFRPLLDVAADEVRERAVALHLPFVDDPSNVDVGIARNEIRHDVLPHLRRVVPTAEAALARAARLLSIDDAYLNRLAESVPMTRAHDGVYVPRAAIAVLDEPIASRVVRRALRAVFPDGYPGASSDVQAAMAVANGRAARVQLPHDVVAAVEGPWLFLGLPGATIPPPRPLAVPGIVRFGPVCLFASLSEVPAVGRARQRLVPLDRLIVRAAEAGDRTEIDAGHKLVFDALAEAHVPARLRPAWPVVERDGRIAAIAGVRVAPWARAAAVGPWLLLHTQSPPSCEGTQ